MPPTVEIRFRKKSAATQFVFTIPVPPEFKKSCGAAYRMIFRDFDWQEAVREAYVTGTYGGKQISAYIPLGLHEAFIRAVELWLTEPRKWGPQYQSFASEAARNFNMHSSAKTGPQLDPRAAWWAADRFNHLHPQVKRLRRDFRHRNSATKTDLATAIERIAPWDIVRDALKDIFAEQQHIEPRQFLTPELSNHELTLAILRVELKRNGYDFQTISFRTYLRFGRDLLKLLAGAPLASSATTVPAAVVRTNPRFQSKRQ